MKTIIHKVKRGYLCRALCYFILFIGGTYYAKAQDFENPIVSDTFEGILDAIVTLMMQIGFPLAVVFIIWSGFLFVTAQGSEDKLKKAKTIFTWTLVGTAIIVAAKIIAIVVINFAKSL